MKAFLLVIAFCISLAGRLNAQVGIGTPNPAASAVLDVSSTSKGFLPPRMTTAERNLIDSPVAGLQIFNTTTNCLEFYVNNFWQPVACGCSTAPAAAPAAGVHAATINQITWNWSSVNGAAGYKYNTVNNYATATDNGNLLSYTQTGLTCTGSNHTLYVWAYNACGVTPPVTLSASLIFPVTVQLAGNGSGTVTSSPAGINCGSACSQNYSCNSVVTLTATPATGSVFSGWSGGPCTGTGTCVVTSGNAAAVTATFTLLTYTLTLNKPSGGFGFVGSSPAGISCGSGCSTQTAVFNYGTVVTLSRTAPLGVTFTGWSGSGCSGTGNCTVTMTGPITVNANFQ